MLYGKVGLDGSGRAIVTSAGVLASQHAYLREGASAVVGLIDINSPITDLSSASGAAGSCVFPEWPCIGGTPWYAPRALTGEVSVGPLVGGYSVTSSGAPEAPPGGEDTSTPGKHPVLVAVPAAAAALQRRRHIRLRS